MSATRSSVFLRIPSAMIATLLLSAPAIAGDFRVETVKLSSGGLAEIIGRAEVGNDGMVEMEVSVKHVDDILKSLTVLDGGAKVTNMTLAGSSPDDNVFRRLPFASGDLTDVSRIANAIQGVPVKVWRGNTLEQSGTVLGVSERSGANGAKSHVLSLLDGGTIRNVILDSQVSLEILSDEIKKMLSEAVKSQERKKTDNVRRVRVKLEGAKLGSIKMSYVAPASVWKTSYRLISDPKSGKARLQAWAIVENSTETAWKDVNLTLSSGNPTLLTQKLYERIWRTRRDISADQVVNHARQLGVQAPPRFALASEMMRSQSTTSVSAEVAERGDQLAPPTDAINAIDGGINVLYSIPRAISLGTDETLSLPIIDAEVPVERVVYRPLRWTLPNPVSALKIKNNTGSDLPAGIATIFSLRDGFVGDAQVKSLRHLKDDLLTFGTDRKVVMDARESPPASASTIIIENGILRTTRKHTITTSYSVQGADDAGITVIVDHPKRHGWKVKSTENLDEHPGAYRISRNVTGAKEHLIEVVDERIDHESTKLIDATEDNLLLWSNAAADKAIVSKLKRVWAAKAELSAAQRDLQSLESQSQRIHSHQSRIRENLKAVPSDSTLAATYLENLSNQELELTKIEANVRQGTHKIETLQQKLRDAIKDI